MKKANFTAERIAGFKCNPGKQQTIHWDGKTPGLGLRVTSAGSKSYIFEARLHGRTLRLTIGDIRTWGIGKAQTEATRLKSLTDQGIDPRQLKAEERAKAEAERIEKQRRIITFGEVWPLYLEANKSDWSERHYIDHVKLAAPGGQPKKRAKGLTVAGPLASLLPMLMAEIDGHRISNWLKSESTKRPTSTALSYRLLRAFIRWADEQSEYQGMIPHTAYNSKTVKKALPQSRPKDDCLQREQLPVWFAAVRKTSNPVISAYLQTLLIIGSRREELAKLRWEEVDFQWRSLTILDKVEGQRTIPLPPYVGHLLYSLPRRNEWVFSSVKSKSGRLEEPTKAHHKAITEAGLPPLSLHGLRRSFGTLCEWVEMPTGISAQIMGHKPSAIAEKHYRRRPLDLLRMWHDKIEAWILEQAGIKFDAEQEKPGLTIISTD